MPLSRKVKPYVILGNTPFVTLIVKYSLMIVYGVLATIFGNLSISIVGGDKFSFWWSISLVVLSAGALTSVILWYNKKAKMELVFTLLMICLLFGYSIDIFIRCAVTNSTATMAAGMLPLIINVYPCVRVINILRTFEKL